MKARDESKLSKLLEKTDRSSADKQHALSDILKDIYGSRNGSLHEYGLAEAIDIEDFNIKLESLQTKWEGLCSNFYNWFFTKRKSLFIESIIQSARENSDITGLYYQYDIESLHALEKREQCFKRSAILEPVTHLQDIVIRKQNDEIRAIYGAGNYVHSPEYKKFQIPSHTWHSWSESRRKDHITKFYEYEPSIDDTFIKPSSSGRKPGFQKRQQNREAPDMIVD